MRLTHVLTAVDTKPLYLDYVDPFVRTWRRLFPNVKVVIVVIAKQVPGPLKKHGAMIHRVNPLPHVPTSFQAQCIRLLYPSRLETENDGAVLITDVDMLPLNRSYYTTPLQAVPNHTFVSYRPGPALTQRAMCYCAATSKTWARVFKTADMKATLQQWYDNVDKKRRGHVWSCDQHVLGKAVRNYAHSVLLTDTNTKFRRFHPSGRRARPPQRIPATLKHGHFADYHMHRPYKKYKAYIESIIATLPRKNNVIL